MPQWYHRLPDELNCGEDGCERSGHSPGKATRSKRRITVRRQEIIDGALEVVKALVDSDVLDGLTILVKFATAGAPPGQTPAMNEKVLRCYKNYLLAAQRFGAGARQVIGTLGLRVLEEPSLWGQITERPDSPVFEARKAVIFTIEYLPKLVLLLKPEDLRQNLGKPSEHPQDLIEVLLPEPEHEHSRPQRVAQVLLAVESLYEAIALLEGQSENTLSLVACDSGSDKSFDLLGAAKLVATLKELLISVWDRVVFYREIKLGERLGLVAQSLPILDRVSKMQREQSIGPEEAEIVRRKILDGVGQFLTSGATIPEMKARSHFDPRELMAPEPKLLTSGSEPEQSPEVGLTEEEQRQLDELQRKEKRFRVPRKPEL
jgi:hypothetical protein